MVVEDHEVLADANGCDRETTSLVRGDFTSQFDCLDKHLMGSGWGGMLAWDNKRVCGN